MAHLIESMAYTNATPWHGLGNRLSPKQPLEVWAKQAGMDWQIRESPVYYIADSNEGIGMTSLYEDQKVLYRSDTEAALSVVSQRYQVVQPSEILEFYRDLTRVSGFFRASASNRSARPVRAGWRTAWRVGWPTSGFYGYWHRPAPG